VSFQPPPARTARLIAMGLGLVFCSACGAEPRPDRGRYVPDAEAARHAVEKVMNDWRESRRIERTTTKMRPILFVEQQQPPGQRLVDFEILGETPGYEAEGYRRFLVRLTLDEPEDSVVAAYYVFGEGPIWVYRAEDFDMIMHMDKSMMPPPPPAAGGDRPSPSEAVR
jgi:hypothetical protein